MKNKPRILFIATFPPPIHGSAMVSQQIKDSKLINDAFDGDYVNLGTSRKMEEIGKGGVWLNLKKLGRFAGSFLKTFGLLLTHRYDLCYCAITCHGSGFLKDAPFVLLCKMFSRKIVIHQHNKGMAKDVDRPVYRWLLPMVYRHAKVILLSWHLYPDIEKVVDRKDVLICPNGIKPTVDPNFKRELNAVPHILFLSNLLIDKGVLVLLDALKILKDKGCSFVCDFVGSETKDIDAVRFANEVEKRGLNSIAVYHGRKYGTEKDAYFKQADTFVLPSFYNNEAFPLVNIEAMEYKLPIVSTNVGGIPDEIRDGDSGFVVEPKDTNALADAICKLIGDAQLRRKMGDKAYALFREYFTQEHFEESFVDALKIGGGKRLTMVNYWGRKYGCDKEEYWRSADIFVFPTLNEAFGLVLLEAMEHGLPCVSTDEGGINDIIDNGKTGFLVPSRDAESLSESIGKLLNDSCMREKMGDRGRRVFEQRYTQDFFEENMLHILNQVLS